MNRWSPICYYSLKVLPPLYIQPIMSESHNDKSIDSLKVIGGDIPGLSPHPYTIKCLRRRGQRAVATCGRLLHASLSVYSSTVWACTKNLGLNICLAFAELSSLWLHMLYLQPCLRVRAVHVNIFLNEIVVYPHTHKREHFVYRKMLVIMDDPKGRYRNMYMLLYPCAVLVNWIKHSQGCN